MKKEHRTSGSRLYYVLPAVLACAVLVSGYTAIAEAYVILDGRTKTGGDIFHTEGVEDFDIFKDLRPGFGEDAIIQPGDEGTYSFTIENRGNVPMDVYFRFFDENVHQIPMAYRLKTGEQYLMGDEKNWEDNIGLARYEIKDSLQKGELREYELDWCWQNDLGELSDRNDTLIGDLAAAGEDIHYTINLDLHMEEQYPDPNPTEMPQEPEPTPTITPEEPEGDSGSIEDDHGQEESEGTGNPGALGDQGELEIPDFLGEWGDFGDQNWLEDVQLVQVDPAKTGDESQTGLFAGLLAAASGLIAFLLWNKKKQEKKGGRS